MKRIAIVSMALLALAGCTVRFVGMKDPAVRIAEILTKATPTPTPTPEAK